MHNPWLDLPAQPQYILPMDQAAVDDFNRTAADSHRIHLDVFPEPFVGSPDAKIVLLALNPGYCDKDREVQAEPDFAEAYWKCLRFQPQDYPFYYLGPRFHHTPGSQWWRSHLRSLIDDSSERTVAQNLLCIQVFPYASRKYAFPRPLPSLDYALTLLRAAIERQAHIVIMRHARAWCKVAPELDDYQLQSGRVYRLNSPLSVHITPRNCPGYPAFRSALATS